MSDFRGYDISRAGQISTVETRNKVLRNTYLLLALSMVPTVFGAWLGIATGITTRSGGGSLVFMLVAFGLIFAIQKFRNSSAGVALLLAFTFVMGMLLSRLIGMTLGFSNGASLIMLAFGGTSVIFASMATIATVSKRNFAGMSSWLFMGLIILLLASVANIFLHLPALMLVVSVLAIVIFSAYMLYDLQRVINGGETNYVSATLSIYLDLYNVFANLLMLLGIFGGNRNN